MNGGKIYRLNIRFDLTDEHERQIAERLLSLDRKQYGSINKFIIAAVGKALDRTDGDTLTAEQIRRIVREELQNAAIVSERPAPVQSAVLNLTDEERAENERSVLNDLELFG